MTSVVVRMASGGKHGAGAVAESLLSSTSVRQSEN